MELRRVQMTGGSSFVVTLPKGWIQEMRIKKNDPVGLIVQPGRDTACHKENHG